jgi:hypothetical protein
MDEWSGFFVGFDEELGRELEAKRQDHDAVLFTSEHFHSRLSKVDQIASLKDYLDRYFTEYQIICYFREQSKVRTSLYSTGLKVNNAQHIRDFQSSASRKTHYYNYLGFFRKWEEVFGRNALCPRIFDKRLFADGDIRVDFLRLLLPDVDAAEFDFNTKSVNESLTQRQAFFFRLVNKHRPQFVGRFADPTPVLLKAAMGRTEALKKGAGISDPRQPEFYEEFADSNREFFSPVLR